MNKKNKSIIIFSVQEAFVSLFPYLLVRASCTLILIFNNQFLMFDDLLLAKVVKIIYDIFPLLICLSLSIHLSKNHQLSQSIFTVFVTTSFLLLSGYFDLSTGQIVVSPKQTTVYSITLPFIMLFLIILIKKKLPHFFNGGEVGQKNVLKQSLVYIWLYSFILMLSIAPFFNNHKAISSSLFSLFSYLSIEMQGLAHILISNVLWLFGIHGTTTYRYTFDVDFYYQSIFEGLPYENFFAAFVIFGGSGSTLSLVIAILFFSKDKNYKTVAKGSIPFSIFNINEPIIYGLPIVLNKYLALPFVFVPVCNFILSIIMLKLNILSFSMADVPWTTPALISGYLLTDSLLGSLWQATLITLGVFLYRPFVKKENNFIHLSDTFIKKLQLTNELTHTNNDFVYFNKHQNITEEKLQIETTLQEIINGQLELYYQPQVDIKSQEIYGFEALLRLIKNEQSYPPIFLSAIEKAGLEEVIDMWCVRRIAEEIEKWSSTELNSPLISINLYPKTLLNSNNVTSIINLLADLNVKVEILERGFSNHFEAINSALLRLKSAGIESSIDDFGSNESNLSLLGIINATTIKMDRDLLIYCDTAKGRTLYKYSCNTFKKMGFTIISEGVETQEQFDFIKSCEIDVMQGWYYSKALPLEIAVKYRVV